MPKNETGSFLTDFAQENEESSVKSLPTITFCNSNHHQESESEANNCQEHERLRLKDKESISPRLRCPRIANRAKTLLKS
jgi:hypothetical protein